MTVARSKPRPSLRCPSCGLLAAHEAVFCSSCGGELTSIGAGPDPTISSAFALCRQRSAGMAVVCVPAVACLAVYAAVTFAAMTSEAGMGAAAGLVGVVLVLLLLSAIPVALCFTLGVHAYAGATSGVAGWQRGLRTAPVSVVLVIVLGVAATLLLAIPYVGWVAAFAMISVLLLSYPMLAFEDVGLFSAWQRLWELLRLARSRSGLLGPLAGLFAILGGILFAAFVAMMAGAVLALSVMDAPAEEHPGIRMTVGALYVIGMVISALVVPWSTVTLAWVTQAYARIRDLQAGSAPLE